MKEIKKEHLENLKGKYLNDKISTLSRHALNKTKISDLVRVGERSKVTRDNFSINLDTLPVTNQQASGRCWIFAGCNILREKIAKRYNLENFELSQNYVSFYDKLERCNYFMETVITLLDKEKDDRTLSFILNKGIEDGGQWDMFANVVQKYGLVPNDVYPETYQSSNTKEIDNLINRYLRKFTSEIRKMNTNGSREKIINLQEKCLDQIYKLLCSCFGVPPTNFSFEYVDKDKNYNIIKNITPIQFLEDFVEVDLNEYISIINSPTEDRPFNQLYTVKYLGNVIEKNKIKYLNLSMNRLKELALIQLTDREPIWFGSDCSKYGDRDEGVWDDMSYREADLLQIDIDMSKEEMLDMGESRMNHAMVLTGVNVDDEKITKWRIQNSWGDKTAHKGYYVATDTWFDNYVYQVVINKKYLNEEELKVLKNKPIELEPWDPMGTLA